MQYYLVTGIRQGVDNMNYTPAGDLYPKVFVSYTQICSGDGIMQTLSGKACAEFSLPTEAQWEYACRAGTTTKYFWSDEQQNLYYDCPYMWYGYNGTGRINIIGTKLPNDWELYDMLGNASEWCIDGALRQYGEDPIGAIDTSYNRGGLKVIRGGGAGSPSYYCTSASYFTENHPYYSSYLGFRVVMNLSK